MNMMTAPIEAKPANRNPSAPFMTSTLQQEASRKFGMGARQTMSAAQRLYEAGLITYMRTDGIDMAPEAVQAARAVIGVPHPSGRAAMRGTKARTPLITPRRFTLIMRSHTSSGVSQIEPITVSPAQFTSNRTCP